MRYLNQLFAVAVLRPNGMHRRNSYHIFIAHFGFGDLSFLFEAERFSSNILNLFGRGARVNTMPPGEAGFGVGMRCVAPSNGFVRRGLPMKSLPKLAMKYHPSKPLRSFIPLNK